MPTTDDANTSLSHPATRLAARLMAAQAPICVGLDPVIDRLPAAVGGNGDLPSIASFCEGVLDAVAPFSPLIKVQSACFERYGSAGVATLERVVEASNERGFEVILDAKRGDIGISASHYAHAAKAIGAQWVTLNGYLGVDGIRPFLDEGLGVFVLVRTSNPSGDELQDVQTTNEKTVAACVGEIIARLGEEYVDCDGHSSVGAVVGATKPEQAKTLRAVMPNQPFLLPGYGAQGGGAEGVEAALDASRGGVIVTASRSIIYAQPTESETWTDAIARAAEAFAIEIREVVVTS